MSQDKQFYTTFFTIMGGLAVLAIILIILAGNLTSDISNYKPKEVVLENIKPVGQVNIAGQTSQAAEPAATQQAAAAAPAAPAAPATPRTGEQIYKSTCVGCHGTGAAGAPKFGDAAAWAPRIAQGMDTLLAHATKGFKVMPPKGTCMNCTEAELKSAIEYMVDHSK